MSCHLNRLTKDSKLKGEYWIASKLLWYQSPSLPSFILSFFFCLWTCSASSLPHQGPSNHLQDLLEAGGRLANSFQVLCRAIHVMREWPRRQYTSIHAISDRHLEIRRVLPSRLLHSFKTILLFFSTFVRSPNPPPFRAVHRLKLYTAHRGKIVTANLTSLVSARGIVRKGRQKRKTQF